MNTNLYNEQGVSPQPLQLTIDELKERYELLANQLDMQIDFSSNVIFLNSDINETTLAELMIRVRALLTKPHRPDVINLMINSNGGDLIETLAIIDFIETLDVKVNVICRGRAYSAAAVILACGTGTRAVSRRSSVMFHQSYNYAEGKFTDAQAYIQMSQRLESEIYELLASKTRKDSTWWKDNMKTDLFLTTNQLLEYGVIDAIL
jgi:ATP-dependent Clp protease protease subunit